MSYSVTVYFNDADIYSTRIYGVNGFVNVTKYYGDSAYSASGFSGRTTFTATPDDDCEFTRWVYRVIEEGETEADTVQQFSTANPFVFTGGSSGNASIIIRAEGKTTAVSPWVAWQDEQLNISTYEQGVDIQDYYTGDYVLSPYHIHRYTAVFDYSGYAHFYTVSSIDTFGYLSDEYDWNDENSGPMYEIASDDDSGPGTNFDIRYYVTAGVEYNIYVRGLNGTESGAVTLYITEPWERNFANFGTLSAAKSTSIYLYPCTLYCRQVSFSTSGTVTVSTSGSLDTKGWVSTSAAWDRGEPTSYIAYNDNYNNDTDFTLTFDAVAGQTYYIWFRCWDAGSSGTVTLNISKPVSAWTVQAYSFGTISSEASASFSLGTKQMRRYSVSFENSGSANFFAMGSEDTWGYLSTTTGFDSTNGMPTSYLAEDGTSGPGDNFAITYNVTAGTTYYIWVCESYGESTGTIELYVQPPEKTISITKWSWTASNGNASASLTQAAYSAVVNKTAVTNFSYLVWNDLCDKVKEILDATGGSWDSTYATYANTKMTSSNKTLTATKFNSLRYNIGSHYSTGITDVYPNDDVLGSYFTKLASCINGWIDTL